MSNRSNGAVRMVGANGQSHHPSPVVSLPAGGGASAAADWQAEGAGDGLGVLRAVADVISNGVEIGSALDDVIEICARTTVCRGALIYLWDEPSKELVVQAATADFSFAVGAVRLRLGQGLTGWSAMTRQPGVIARHPTRDPRFISVTELDDASYQSCLTVPLIAHGGRLMGVITLHSDNATSFDEVVEHVQAVATLVADALRVAELDRQLVERDESLRQLAEAASIHEAEISAVHRLYTVSRVAKDLMRSDLGSIITFDSEQLTVRIATWCTDEAVTLQQQPVPLDAEWARYLYGSASAHRVSDGSPFRSIVGGATIFSTCFVSPIVVAGEPVGLVCSLAKEFAALSEAKERDLVTLARIAAPAVAEIRSRRVDPTARSAQSLFQLLRAGDTESAHVHQLVRDLGLCASEPNVVLECTGGASAAPSPTLGVLQDRLLETFPGALVDVGPNILTAVLPHRGTADRIALDRLARTLLRNAAEHIGIGFSEPTMTLSDYPDRMSQASVAATMSRAANPAGVLVNYRDLGADRVLWSLAMQPHTMSRASSIERLVEYDRERGTELLSTLETYLSLGASLHLAASELFLHRNTLRKRLDRISELTGLRLDDDPSCWFHVMLAIRLHKLRESIR